jgi:hypothetical protein
VDSKYMKIWKAHATHLDVIFLYCPVGTEEKHESLNWLSPEHRSRECVLNGGSAHPTSSSFYFICMEIHEMNAKWRCISVGPRVCSVRTYLTLWITVKILYLRL